MDLIWTGRMVGTFYGYAPGRTYELSDGSKWKQDCTTDEPVYSEGPDVQLLTKRGSGVIYLAVEDATSMARVSLVASPVKSR